MRNWVCLTPPPQQTNSLPILLSVRLCLADPSARAALCQIFDSIYLDVPMSRVKFNVNTEYAYLQNFKILQSTISTPRPSPSPANKILTNLSLQTASPAMALTVLLTSSN